MTNGENEIPEAQLARDTSKLTPVAPLWHTIPLLVLIVGLSLLQGVPKLQNANIQPNRLATYIGTMVYELFLLGYVWLVAVLRYKVPLRDLIGGRWKTLLDFIKDVGVALLFECAVIGLLLTAHFALKFSGAAAANGMLPVTVSELTAFIILSVFAGFCEEIVFRGYLLRQFSAWTGSAWIGVILQGIVFGLAHGYQGWKGMLVISVYGTMFGILVVLRKSLRPGIMQHCGQDAFSGVIAWVATKQHIPMPTIIRF